MTRTGVRIRAPMNHVQRFGRGELSTWTTLKEQRDNIRKLESSNGSILVNMCKPPAMELDQWWRLMHRSGHEMQHTSGQRNQRKTLWLKRARCGNLPPRVVCPSSSMQGTAMVEMETSGVEKPWRPMVAGDGICCFLRRCERRAVCFVSCARAGVDCLMFRSVLCLLQRRALAGGNVSNVRTVRVFIFVRRNMCTCCTQRRRTRTGDAFWCAAAAQTWSHDAFVSLLFPPSSLLLFPRQNRKHMVRSTFETLSDAQMGGSH